MDDNTFFKMPKSWFITISRMARDYFVITQITYIITAEEVPDEISDTEEEENSRQLDEGGTTKLRQPKITNRVDKTGLVTDNDNDEEGSLIKRNKSWAISWNRYLTSFVCRHLLNIFVPDYIRLFSVSDSADHTKVLCT